MNKVLKIRRLSSYLFNLNTIYKCYLNLEKALNSFKLKLYFVKYIYI